LDFGRPGGKAAIIGDDFGAGEFPSHLFFNLFYAKLKKDLEGMIGFHLIDLTVIFPLLPSIPRTRRPF
jgi:hypothetical protein